MNKETIILHEHTNVHDKLNGLSGATPTRTVIQIIDHNTGEVLETLHNKILVTGSQVAACKQFGIEQSVAFPTYNTALKLENSSEEYSKQPLNEPITCLWCAGRSGTGTTPGSVLVVSNTDRIEPENDIIPFRYVSNTEDLDEDQRAVYFGRKIFEDTGMIGYYTKAFDTEPQLHVRYLDGTEVTKNMYNVVSSEEVEVYVETILSVNRLDFREYIDKVLGWDKADISTVSLLIAWYDDTIAENPEADEKDRVYYKWYQDIIPFNKFNFKSKDLSDLTTALDFRYQIYY
mgnify:FL=1